MLPGDKKPHEAKPHEDEDVCSQTCPSEYRVYTEIAQNDILVHLVFQIQCYDGQYQHGLKGKHSFDKENNMKEKVINMETLMSK